MNAPASLLSTATKGYIQRPHKFLIHGVDGVGKSSFVAEAPKPIFVQAGEDGTNHLDVTRVTVHSLTETRQVLTELATMPHDFETVGIDAADGMEALIQAHVIATHDKKISSIEDIPYGKGRVKVLETWRELLPLFDAILDRGLNLGIISHSYIKKFEDPSTPQGYERYQLKLQAGAGTDTSALLREYVDTVMFANFEVAVTEKDKHRAFGQGDRKLYTERRPAFDAKNRLGLPFELPLSWDAYAKAAAKGRQQQETTGEVVTVQSLNELAAQVTDAARREKVLAAIAGATTPAELVSIKNRLLTLLNGGKK